MGLFAFGLAAQSPRRVFLNRHFFEIDPNDSLNHVFTKIISYTPDSVKIARIFNKENQLD
jgi:hypothetical protein